MSYSVTTLDGERKPRRLPARELDPIEIRVLGCLMEKQLSTPEYYPLTLNALRMLVATSPDYLTS